MSSLLNKLKGHGSDKHHTSSDPNDSYNQPSSNTGYDNANTSGYGNTTSPTHHGETGYGNTQNTSSGYNDGPLNSHSDGGKYYPPKGTAVGQGHNTETAGPHNNNTLNRLDPRVDSDQSKLHKNTQQGYEDSGYGQSGYNSNQPGYGNTTQGPHSSNLANKADPRIDSDNSRANHGYGTTTTTTTNTSTSVGHDQYGTTHGTTHDANKRLPADPNHPTMMEKVNPKVETDASRRHDEYGNTGYGNTAGSNQYDSTHDSHKRLPENPNHPTMMEKANPDVLTDRSRRHEEPGYGGAGYSNTSGSDQYGHETNKQLPKDPNHPTMMEKLNPKVDTDSSRRNEYDNTSYGNSGTTGTHSSNLANRADPRIDTENSSHHHGHNDQYAAGAAGAYAGSEAHRHHGQSQAVRNDDTSMMNRSHPPTSMHPSDRRYDSNRLDQQTGPDGEYLPGPAPTTAGPHKSDMVNKLDPRVDSDQSKLEKEREREGYGNTNTYGNEHERRINEGHHHQGTTGTGIGHQNQHDRNSGYDTTNAAPALPHRKAVNDPNTNTGIGNYNSSSPSTHNNAPLHHATTAGSGAYGSGNNNSGYNDNAGDDDRHNFECAKCGHHNTHLRRNNRAGGDRDQYGNTTTHTKPSLMEKINPKVDSNGDGKAGFMK